MKRKIILSSVFLGMVSLLWAQPDKIKYPEPEFSKEVYFLKKDSVNSVLRLEKETSKMEGKTKMGGMGGYENGYTIEGEKSSVRLPSGNGLSFVFSSGALTGSSSHGSDSMMMANGMDPSMMAGMMGGMDDPANTIALYKADESKGKRKILMQKAGGAFGGKKNQSSDKFTFSVRKIREGYWELVIDKKLPKGEYAFTSMNFMSMGANMDGSITLFTFAVEN